MPLVAIHASPSHHGPITYRTRTNTKIRMQVMGVVMGPAPKLDATAGRAPPIASCVASSMPTKGHKRHGTQVGRRPLQQRAVGDQIPHRRCSRAATAARRSMARAGGASGRLVLAEQHTYARSTTKARAAMLQRADQHQSHSPPRRPATRNRRGWSEQRCSCFCARAARGLACRRGVP